jgi:hypothetical protein
MNCICGKKLKKIKNTETLECEYCDNMLYIGSAKGYFSTNSKEHKEVSRKYIKNKYKN